MTAAALARPGVGAVPALLLAGLALSVSQLAAQGFSFRAGALRGHYGDSLDGSAASIGARALLIGAPVQGSVEGSVSRFDGGAWAAQGDLGALWLATRGGPVSAGLSAVASASYLEAGTISGSAGIGPVLSVAGGPWIVNASGAGGVLRGVDGLADHLFSGALRLAYVRSAWSLAVTVGGADAGRARFQDASGALELRSATVTGAVTGGYRTGDLGDESWVQGRAAWRFAPWASLEVGAGTYPPDPTGFTRGSFVVAGLRLGLTRAAVAPDFAPAQPARVLVERSGEGEVRAVFTVRDADSLAIAGEWSEWTPIPLTPLGGHRWMAILPLGPGVHRFTLVDRQGRWFVPPGILSVPDDFGGKAGLLFVES